MVVSLSSVRSASAANTYFEEENYYSQDDGYSNSEWRGQLAYEQGLKNRIRRGEFETCLAGRSLEGQQLVQLRKNRRPGTDLTASAPKSVTLAALVGKDERVIEAHKSAVRSMVDFVESNLVQVDVRQKGRKEIQSSEFLQAAIWHHDVSRELDPQLHSHCVIANYTRDNDGEWRSMDVSLIYKHQLLIGAVYHNELARNLHEIGYKTVWKSDGTFELEGVTSEQIDAFSTRRSHVLSTVGAGASAKRREFAVLDTRQAKGKALDRESLERYWIEKGKEIGLSSDRPALSGGFQPRTTRKAVVNGATDVLTEYEVGFDKLALLKEALRQSRGEQPLKSVEQEIRRQIDEQQILKSGDDSKLTTSEAVQRENWVLAASRSGRDSSTSAMAADDVLDAITQYESKTGLTFNSGQRNALVTTLTIKDRHLIWDGVAGAGKTFAMKLLAQLATQKGYKVTGWAQTAEACKELQRSAELAGGGTVAKLLNTPSLPENLARLESALIKAQQWLATYESRFEQLIQREQRISGWRSKQQTWQARADEQQYLASQMPGQTLASHYLEKARKYRAWAAQYTGRLAEVDEREVRQLRELTQQRIEQAQSRVRELSIRCNEARSDIARVPLWIIDEAGLLGSRDLYSLFARAEELGARVILSGDTRQLAAIGAGAPYRLLQARQALEVVHLNESLRQVDVRLKEAVDLAARGKVSESFAQLQQDGRVRQIESREERARAVALDYLSRTVEDRRETLILAGTNLERKEITSFIRDDLRTEGSLGQAATFDVLKRKELDSWENKQVAYYELGDVVVFNREYKNLGNISGEPYRVVALDVKYNTAILANSDGQELRCNLNRFIEREVFQPEVIEYAVGDRGRFTRNDRITGTTNGQVFYVSAISEDGTLTLATGGKEQVFTAGQLRHSDHAYAQTVYSAQGKTANFVVYCAQASRTLTVSREAYYVAISRARHAVSIYTECPQALGIAIQRSQSKANALELVARTSLNKQKEELLDDGRIQERTPGDEGVTDRSSRPAGGNRGSSFSGVEPLHAARNEDLAGRVDEDAPVPRGTDGADRQRPGRQVQFSRSRSGADPISQGGDGQAVGDGRGVAPQRADDAAAFGRGDVSTTHGDPGTVKRDQDCGSPFQPAGQAPDIAAGRAGGATERTTGSAGVPGKTAGEPHGHAADLDLVGGPAEAPADDRTGERQSGKRQSSARERPIGSRFPQGPAGGDHPPDREQGETVAGRPDQKARRYSGTTQGSAQGTDRLPSQGPPGDFQGFEKPVADGYSAADRADGSAAAASLREAGRPDHSPGHPFSKAIESQDSGSEGDGALGSSTGRGEPGPEPRPRLSARQPEQASDDQRIGTENNPHPGEVEERMMQTEYRGFQIKAFRSEESGETRVAWWREGELESTYTEVGPGWGRYSMAGNATGFAMTQIDKICQGEHGWDAGEPGSAGRAALPVPSEAAWPDVRRYLQEGRGLPAQMIDDLKHRGLIYADSERQAVFVRQTLRLDEGRFERGSAEAATTIQTQGVNQGAVSTIATTATSSPSWFYFGVGVGNADNPQISRLICCKDPIDALSYAYLDRVNWSDTTLYISTGESMLMPGREVIEVLEGGGLVVLAYDDEDAHNQLSSSSTPVTHFPTEGANWSHELCSRQQMTQAQAVLQENESIEDEYEL